MLSGFLARLTLRAIQRWDRWRLRRLCARHSGLEIDPTASSNLAVADFLLEPGARLRIGPGVVTERLRGELRFVLEPNANVEIGADTWLCTRRGPVRLFAFEGGRIEVGPENLLNGCELSAKERVTLGRRCFVGPSARIFDADQHDLAADRPERIAPVQLADYVWVASSALVLRGVTIGEHSVIGAMSLVTGEIPPHSLAYGQPARVRGQLGDRSQTS